MKQIDYYFWVNSDWAYLGADRLEEIAARHGAVVEYMPIDLPFVYSQTGGVLLSQRSPERQAYRLAELERWCSRLSTPINFTPRYMCPDGDLASCMVIAAKRRGLNVAPLARAIGHAEWVDERDISSPETLISAARDLGLDGRSLLNETRAKEICSEYSNYTRQAIEAGVFGSPSYVYRGELFWGQDRLDFLDWRLQSE